MGSVVISVDAELGWGFHDLPTPPRNRLEYARWGWQRLSELCEQYDVPATWAVVGHLLLSECDRTHEDHPTESDWFRREREDWRLRPDLRFGSELVEPLQRSSVGHEIGCHSFSHVVFNGGVDETIIRAELAAALEAGDRFGIEYDSFVFPRNVVGYRDLLAEYGFTVYRGADSPQNGFRRQLSKVGTTLDPERVSLVEPRIDEYGLVNLPPSLFLYGFQGRVSRANNALWVDPIVRQARGAIDHAIEEDGIVHLWLHPNNLMTEQDVDRLRAIFEHIDRRRSDGLTVDTMAEIASEASP